MNKKKLVIIYLLLIFFDMWKYSFWLEKKKPLHLQCLNH